MEHATLVIHGFEGLKAIKAQTKGAFAIREVIRAKIPVVLVEGTKRWSVDMGLQTTPITDDDTPFGR